MGTFELCVDLIVPDEIDIAEVRPDGKPWKGNPPANPFLEEVREVVSSDARWTLRRVGSTRPDSDKRQHLRVWITVSSASRDEARKTAQAGVADLVTNTIPAARVFTVADE